MEGTIPSEIEGKKVSLRKVVAGSKEDEFKLHKALGRFSVCGEWYTSECVSDARFKEFFASRDPVTEDQVSGPKPITIRLRPAVMKAARIAAAEAGEKFGEWIEAAVMGALPVNGKAKR